MDLQGTSLCIKFTVFCQMLNGAALYESIFTAVFIRIRRTCIDLIICLVLLFKYCLSLTLALEPGLGAGLDLVSGGAEAVMRCVSVSHSALVRSHKSQLRAQSVDTHSLCPCLTHQHSKYWTSSDTSYSAAATRMVVICQIWRYFHESILVREKVKYIKLHETIFDIK